MPVMAGRYAPLIAGAAGAAALGAGGSLLGNMMDAEKGEGLGRLATEALAAGLNVAPAGAILAGIPLVARAAKQAAVAAIKNKSPEAGAYKKFARETGKQAGPLMAGYSALMPVSAGIGGLIGGGASNIANAIGLPGFQPGINPESYGSSNMQYQA